VRCGSGDQPAAASSARGARGGALQDAREPFLGIRVGPDSFAWRPAGGCARLRAQLAALGERHQRLGEELLRRRSGPLPQLSRAMLRFDGIALRVLAQAR